MGLETHYIAIATVKRISDALLVPVPDKAAVGSADKQERNKARLPQTTAKTHIKVIKDLSLVAHVCNHKGQKGRERGRKILYLRPNLSCI